MDATIMLTVVGTVSGMFGAGVGVVCKSAVDHYSGKRKFYLDQLQVAIADNKELRADLDKQRGQIHNLQTEVKELSVAKARHEVEATHFRRDITDLQRQVRSLGHVPVVPDNEGGHLNAGQPS